MKMINLRSTHIYSQLDSQNWNHLIDSSLSGPVNFKKSKPINLVKSNNQFHEMFSINNQNKIPWNWFISRVFFKSLRWNNFWIQLHDFLPWILDFRNLFHYFESTFFFINKTFIFLNYFFSYQKEVVESNVYATFFVGPRL